MHYYTKAHFVCVGTGFLKKRYYLVSNVQVLTGVLRHEAYMLLLISHKDYLTPNTVFEKTYFVI